MKTLIFSLTALASLSLAAQKENLGRLQLEVVNRYSAKIAEAEKISSAQPSSADSAVPRMEVRYSAPTFPLKFEPETTPIKPVRISKVEVEAIPAFNGRLGLGSYGTVHGNFSLSSKRSSKWQWTTFLNHRSTRTGVPYQVYDKNQFTSTQVGGAGRYFYKEYSLGGNIRYEHRGVNYYGFPQAWFQEAFNCQDCDYKLAGPSPRRDYNISSLQLDYKSRKQVGTHLLTKAELNYHNLFWSPTNTENYLNVNTDWAVKVKDIPFELGANVTWDRTQFSNGTTGNNWLNMNLYPRVQSNIGPVNIKVGLNLFAATDRKGENEFRFYPTAIIDYGIIPNVMVLTAGIEGTLETYSLRRLIDENPYLNTPDVFQTGRMSAFGALRGKITGNTSYLLKGGVDLYSSMPLFYRPDSVVNGPVNSFVVLSDDVVRGYITAQAGYESGPLRVTLEGTLQSFVTDSLPAAYHKPGLLINGVASYRLKKKLALVTKWYYVSRRDVQPIALNEVRPTSIAGYVDGSIGAEYQFNDLIGFFFDVNNLLSNPYHIWEGYEAQRIRFMLGLNVRW